MGGEVTRKGAYSKTRDLSIRTRSPSTCGYQPDRECPPGQYLKEVAKKLSKVPPHAREAFMRRIEIPIEELLSGSDGNHCSGRDVQ